MHALRRLRPLLALGGMTATLLSPVALITPASCEGGGEGGGGSSGEGVDNLPPGGEEEEGQSLYPGDFSRAEDEKSFTVHPSEGLSLVLQNMVGGGRDAGSVCAQFALTPSGANAVFVCADQRSPSLTAVLQPGGPEGKVLSLRSSMGVGEGVSVEGEVNVTAGGGVANSKVGGRWAGKDFHAAGSMTFPGGGGGEGGPGGGGGGPRPTHGELSYHQSLGAGTGATAGGSLTALFTPGKPLFLPPHPQQLLWGTFASYTTPSKDTAIHARYGLAPNPSGGPMNQALSLAWWRRAAKHLEVGASTTLTTVRYTEPVGSTTSVGMRVAFLGGVGGGGTSPSHPSSPPPLTPTWCWGCPCACPPCRWGHRHSCAPHSPVSWTTRTGTTRLAWGWRCTIERQGGGGGGGGEKGGGGVVVV